MHFLIKLENFLLGATISAPPTTNNPSGSNSNSDPSKSNTIVTTGSTSKIIHPSEDVSLEEIRARRPKYARTIPAKAEDGMSGRTSSASEVSFLKTIYREIKK